MSGLPEESVDFCLVGPRYNAGSKSLPYLDRAFGLTGLHGSRLSAAQRCYGVAIVWPATSTTTSLRVCSAFYARSSAARIFLANISWLTSFGGASGTSPMLRSPSWFMPRIVKASGSWSCIPRPRMDIRLKIRNLDPVGPWRNREHRYPIQDYMTGEFGWYKFLDGRKF